MSEWTSLRAIARAAVELTSRHERDAVLDTILAELERLLPYDMASVLVLDGDELRVVAGRGFRRDVNLSALRFARGENPRIDRALSARGTVRFTEPAEPDPFDAVAPRPLEHLHSCMAAPMRMDGELLGLITADAHDEGRFAPEHEELMELFAALAAVAMRNADLVAELSEARTRLSGQVATLAEEIREHTGGKELIGGTPVMRALREDINLVGETDTSVLILGETGTGKEMVARAIHAASRRRDRPLIRFDCSAVAPTLIESELYGHAKGAFTGAISARPGKFEIADGGTLFLDEIGELPLSLQPRLLRALQEHEVERLGEHRVRHFDVRVIAATNRDLEAEAQAGRFRLDLLHRIAVYPIRVPSLVERLEDVPVLVEHFVHKLAARLQIRGLQIDPAFVQALQGYEWPGNVRELENTIEQALVRVRPSALGKSLLLDANLARKLRLGPTKRRNSEHPTRAFSGSLREATAAFQATLIEDALAANGGNVARAARLLGEDRANLHRRLRRARSA
jgi:anaerobic nitric oxide reductase transcription regulator